MMVPLAIGLFAGGIFGFLVMAGAVSSGVPIVITIGLASLVAMIISLGLWHYILTGEDEPPWWFSGSE